MHKGETGKERQDHLHILGLGFYNGATCHMVNGKQKCLQLTKYMPTLLHVSNSRLTKRQTNRCLFQ